MSEIIINELLVDFNKLEMDLLKQKESIGKVINDLKIKMDIEIGKLKAIASSKDNEPDNNNFSKKIKEQRKKLNKTQEQVAEKLNISLLSYKNYENEKTNIPINKKKLIESFLFNFPNQRITKNFNLSAIDFLEEIYKADIPKIEPIKPLNKYNSYIFTTVTNIFLEAFQNKKNKNQVENERKKIYFQLQLIESLTKLNAYNLGYSLITELKDNKKILVLDFFELSNKIAPDEELLDLDDEGRPSLQVVQPEEYL